MTDAIYVSLDLETWGKKSGRDLRSIGACVFAPVTRHGGSLVHDGSLGTIRPFYVATDNPLTAGSYEHVKSHGRKYPLTRDPETVQWWNDQSEEAQAAFADPVDLRNALIAFADWLRALVGDLYLTADFNKRYKDDICLYTHGPAFDPPILAAAYDACDLPVPWHYRAPRDTRTAFDMAGIDDHSAFMQQYNTGTCHHALDDAISQAKAVCGAFARLRISHDVVTHRNTWRDIIERVKQHTNDDDGTGYYTHELAAFDRTFDALAIHPQLDHP